MKIFFKYSIIAIVLFCSGTVFSQKPADTEDEYQKEYQRRIKKTTINGVYIPADLAEVFVQLTKLTEEKARRKFMALPEDSTYHFLHFSLGRWMIYNWSFYEGSRLADYLKTAGLSYPDDMADFLIVAWHRHLLKKPLEIKTLIEGFKERRKQSIEEERKKGKVISEEKRVRKKN